MNELYELIDQVKNKLDLEESIINLKVLSKKLLNNRELINNIEMYKYNRKDELKSKILRNEDYNKYREYLTELNLIILDINTKLKLINKEGNVNL